MDLSFEQSLLSFDLDLLHEPGNNDVNYAITDNNGSTLQQTTTDSSVSQFEIFQFQELNLNQNQTTTNNSTTDNSVPKPDTSHLQKNSSVRKGISYLKKKIIDTGTLVQQYNARCDQVAKLENNIVTLNNKCREVCIKRDQHRQKSECLEKECDKLRKWNLELEQSLRESDQLKAASEAHSHQLEELVKDQETQIEAFKDEKLLTKETIKDLEKKLNALNTQLCTLADIVVTKRPLSKTELLSISKYVKLKEKKDTRKKKTRGKHIEDSEDCEDHALSDTEDFTKLNNEKNFSLPLCPPKQYASIIKLYSRKDDIDSDSLDEGRGSSLTHSDSDTLSSPEYYLNSSASQISVRNCKNKGTKLANSDASSISKKKIVDRATSPILELAHPPSQLSNTESAKPETVDKALSPIKYPNKDATKIGGIETIISENTCRNLSANSDTFLNDNPNDCEVEMIFKSMRLNARLVTPIPSTPSRSLAGSPQTKRRKYAEFKEFNSAKKQTKKLPRRTIEIQEAGSSIESDDGNISNIVDEQDTNVVLEKVSETVTEDNSIIRECEHKVTTIPRNEKEKKALPVHELDVAFSCVNETIKKCSKTKKLTRLQRLKNNLMPKSKIRPDLPPPRVLRSRKDPKTITNNINTNISDTAVANEVNGKVVSVVERVTSQLKLVTSRPSKDMHVARVQSQQNTVTPARARKRSINKLGNNSSSPRKLRPRTDPLSANKINTVRPESSVSLNSKEVYENAVRVMAELNSRQNDDSPSNTNKKVQISGANILEQKEDTPKISKIKNSNNDKHVSTELLNDEEQNNIAVSVSDSTDADDAVKTQSKITSNNITNNAIRRKLFSLEIHESIENNNESKVCNKNTKDGKNVGSQLIPNSNDSPSDVVSYSDLDIFDDQPVRKKSKSQNTAINTIPNPEESILCRLINKYGSAKYNTTKKIPESITVSLSTKLTEYIARASEAETSSEAKPVLNKIIQEVQKWEFQEFLAGVMHYLLDPTRKLELFNQIYNPSAPRMTKSEQVLLVIVTRCTWNNINTINTILNEIEYTLFRLNQTPEMKVVESMAHFYAVMCRYIGGKNRLRRFMADALYCMNYSAVALIKQCLDVWMLVLPLAHMGEAKQPLVISIVYVLHFFKCDDKTNKVQEIRNILKRKYFYDVTNWNETKMLETLNNAILELSDHPLERQNLQMSLYLIAKRYGPNWCQTKLIEGLLKPIIANENTPERVKVFCVSALGRLFRPFPVDMKIHCEIAMNQLLDMLDENPSPPMTEAIFTSLIALSRHNQNRIIKALMCWQPTEVSPEMEDVLTAYVADKPVKAWSSILNKISLVK